MTRRQFFSRVTAVGAAASVGTVRVSLFEIVSRNIAPLKHWRAHKNCLAVEVPMLEWFALVKP